MYSQCVWGSREMVQMPSSKAGAETRTESGLWAQQRVARGGEGGMNWEMGFDVNTLPCIKQAAGGSLQCNQEAQLGGL